MPLIWIAKQIRRASSQSLVESQRKSVAREREVGLVDVNAGNIQNGSTKRCSKCDFGSLVEDVDSRSSSTRVYTESLRTFSHYGSNRVL